MQKRNITCFLILICSSILTSLCLAQPLPSLSSDYLGFIQQRVNSFIVYPTSARLNGWEGVVKVKFVLSENGRIKEIDVAESSGYPLLDATAIMAVKDASPYPFPEDYPANEIEIVVPVNYTGTGIRVTPAESLLYPEQDNELPQETPLEVLKEASKLQEVALTSEAAPSYSPEELARLTELAISKNQPIQVAQGEVQLAQLKVTEAKRNLLPGLKVQGYTTDGDIYKIDYEEREIKFQVDQPLFHSGKLQDTLKQSLANLEITEKNLDRLKFDVYQKTETAYYNLIASRMHIKLKESLQQEALGLLKSVEKLGGIGMIIPLEVNSARSWMEQIDTQIKSLKHELQMAELTMKQVINAPELPAITSDYLSFKKLDISLNDCVEMAFNYRPEVFLSELLIKFYDYGRKIEADKGKFMIDLTGSYGFYQGHYITEPWKDSSNWFAGIKFTKPIGASTLTSSYNHDTSQPRFGQTSPTQSGTLSTELTLFDNMKSLADKKQTNIDYSRSLSDFNETLKTIIFEVQDAFLKYEKAAFQLTTAESEMKFRRSETEVTKVKAMVGEGNLSNALESLYAFSEAQTRYIQALANYYISLANLKKATGYGLRL